MMKSKEKMPEKEPKQYFENVPRKYVYGFIVAFSVVAALLYLCVPHYKPLHLASAQQTTDAHRAIIQKYFLASVNCKDDPEDKAARIKEFNKYFKTNQYANRAVIRGCNDVDTLLAKDANGSWQPVDVVLELNSGFTDEMNKACLTTDIIKENNGGYIDKASSEPRIKKTISACEALAKQSYVEVNFKTGIHFHM